MPPTVQELTTWYRELGPDLLGYFRRQIGLANRSEDLLQETFLRAWRSRLRWPDGVPPRAWLYGIARHVRLDAQRRQTVLATLEGENVVAETENPRLADLREAIMALPEPQREALQLKLQQGLSYEEIAVALGIPVGTVRSRIHYAVLRLKEAMQHL